MRLVMHDGEIGGPLLGTAAYMSPEQARGLPVDKRGDIWAFGCVLYEMLTGRAAFSGDTVSDTIAKILEREPDWAALPASTPDPIRRLLMRCLVKDHKRRLRDIGEARIAIDALGERRECGGAAGADSRVNEAFANLVALGRGHGALGRGGTVGVRAPGRIRRSARRGADRSTHELGRQRGGGRDLARRQVHRVSVGLRWASSTSG